MRNIDSKDYWWASIICLVGMLATPNIIGGFFLFIASIVSSFYYMKSVKRERQEDFIKAYRENQFRNIQRLANLFINLASEEAQAKPKTSRRKPNTSRRSKRK